MRRKTVLFWGLLVTALAATHMVQAQSLTDAMVAAYRNSDALKGARAALRGTDELRAQAYSAKRLQVDLSASSTATYREMGASTTYVSTLALSAGLVLWDGGATDLAIRAADANIAAARANLLDLEQSVLLSAVTTFMDMRRDAQFLQLAENNRSVIARQVQAAHDRFEVGDIRRTDVSQAEARLAAALSMVALRQGTLEISREAYFVATGTYPGVLKPPPPIPGIPATLAEARAVALELHPVIARAKHVVRASELNALRAEAAMKPKLSLSGQAAVTDNALTGNTASLTLGGSMPLNHGGALISAVRQARALAGQSRFDLQRAGLVVTQNVTRFWAQLRIARASITARQKEVRASRVALRGIREEANLGARTTLDVLDAERALVEAQTNLVSAKRDEFVAVYSLLSAMGLLTVKHLQLGIETYEPVVHYNKVKKAPGPSDRAKLLQKIFKRAGRN
ncbi:MAG: TolC family outer membrane protein [Paracoccaceae bacterium]